MAAALNPPLRIYAGIEEFWTHVFGVVGRFAVPAIVAGFVLQAIATSLTFAWIGDPTQLSGADLERFATPFTVIFLLEMVLSIFAATFLTHLVAARSQSPDESYGSSAAAALRRAPFAFFWTAVAGAAIFIGLLILILPGIYIALRLFFVFPVAVLTPGANPIAESWRLTKSKLMRPLLCWLVIIAATILVAMLTAIPALLGQLIGGLLAPIVTFVADWISQAVALALSAIPAVLLYGWNLAEERSQLTDGSSAGV